MLNELTPTGKCFGGDPPLQSSALYCLSSEEVGHHRNTYPLVSAHLTCLINNKY